MSDKRSASGKINSGIGGLGAPTPAMVEQRAQQLASMDGGREPNGADRILARGEFQGAIEPRAPEAPPEIENLAQWDEPPGAYGSRAESHEPDDEANLDETLVEEGLDEAEHDLRLADAKENPPEE